MIRDAIEIKGKGILYFKSVFYLERFAIETKRLKTLIYCVITVLSEYYSIEVTPPSNSQRALHAA